MLKHVLINYADALFSHRPLLPFFLDSNSHHELSSGLQPQTSHVDASRYVRNYEVQLKRNGCTPRRMIALSEKTGCNQMAQKQAVIVRTDLATLSYAFLLKYTIFLTWFLTLKNKIISLIKITSSKRRCDSSLRNVISNLKFCFYTIVAL